jgi:uncharacterized protein
LNGQPVISVRGEATLEVEPEIAVVSVTVQARDRDRETVLHRLADRNRQITDLVKGYGEAVEKLASGPVSVRPELKEKRPASASPVTWPTPVPRSRSGISPFSAT